MKMKKFFAAVVALAMVAALVPGLTVGVSAAGGERYDDLSMEDWRSLTDDPVFTYPANAQNDGVLGSYYTGWSSSWTADNAAAYPDVPREKNNFTGQITNINTYDNSYQVYGGAGSKDTVTLPNYGEGKKFVILEFWHSRDTVDFKHEFAIKDINENIIETGYVRRGNTDDITDGFASGKTENFKSPTPADSATTGVENPVKISTAYNTGVRVVFVNNDDNTYSVIYYLANGSKGNGTDSQMNSNDYCNKYQLIWSDNYWEKMYTATYTGQFNGIGSIDYAVVNATNWYTNHRVNFMRVYTGDVSKKDYEVTITGAGNNDKKYTVKAVRSADIPVPAFEGYVLKTRTAGDNIVNTRAGNTTDTLTLEYAANEENLGTWAVRNNVSGTTPFNKIKFLGSHDSFTDKMQRSTNYADKAGMRYGDGGAQAGNSSWTVGQTYNQSMAQSEGILEQLNAGVRYFDIRLSRQEDGVLWTRHGLISEEFEGIAYTIAQFAEENPGEVIVLDFQDTWDYIYYKVANGGNNGIEKPGDDNEGVYNAIWELLQKTGLSNYVAGNIDLSKSYGDLTDNGTKTSVVCFAKERGANCISQFINRKTNINGVYTDNADLRSVIDYINNNYTGNSPYQIIHAFTTPGIFSAGTLIGQAESNNPQFIKESNFPLWLEKSNVIILNDVVNCAPDYLAKLTEYTRDGFDGKYTNTVEGVTVEGPTASVPFSTELTAEKDGKNYTFKLTQFENSVVQPTGEGVTLTFPDATGGISGLKTVVYHDGQRYEPADGSKDVKVSGVTSFEKPFTVTTEAVDAKGDAKLGYDGTNLTLDFTLEEITSGIKADSFSVTVTNQENTEVGTVTVNSEAPNVILTPQDSNAIYTAVIEAVKGGVNYSVGTIQASLYSEVVENLEVMSGTYDTGVNEGMIAKANEVISHGGIYFTDNSVDSLNDETKKIVKATVAEDGKITVEVNAPYSGYGIGFILADGKVVVGSNKVNASGDAGKAYKSFTVDPVDNSVTLSGGGEAVTLSLDSVNIEFVETLINETAAEGADSAPEFVPEL